MTFRLAPVTCELAEEQDEPNAADNHWNDDPNRGVFAPNDLAPFKRAPEVMLVGYASAPNGPVTSLRTRLIVGVVDKQIEVWADRVLAQNGTVRVGAPFSRMPIRWERAAGGPDTSNPVGVPVGEGRAPDVYGNVALPNLQPGDVVVDGPHASIPPIGFGPIAELADAARRDFRRRAWPGSSGATRTCCPTISTATSSSPRPPISASRSSAPMSGSSSRTCSVSSRAW